MITLDNWHELMHLHCLANAFDPPGLKTELNSNPEFLERFRQRFDWVLQTQPISAQEWERRNNTSFDEDAELYEHLQHIYDFLFREPRKHRQPVIAARIKSKQDFVAADAHIRRSPECRTGRDAALRDPGYHDGRFEVSLPIEEILGSDFRTKVEGVRRIKGTSSVEDVEFSGGRIFAVFSVSSGMEPDLVTLFPSPARPRR